MTLARLESEQPCAARRQLEQQRQQRAVRRPQQQHAIERQQQHWIPMCEGDSRGRAGHRAFPNRAECASPRTSAASRTKARQTRPVFRATSAENEYAKGAGAGSGRESGRERPRAPRSFWSADFSPLHRAIEQVVRLFSEFVGRRVVTRNEFRAPLVAAALVWMISCAPLLAEQGTGISGAFTVDTRWGFSQGAAVSGFFTVDTRISGSASAGYSGLFIVDTLGATTGTAVIAGRVSDSGGAGLGGATVSALLNNVVRAQTATDAGGYFTLSSLPAGTYDVRATKVNYVSAARYGLAMANGQSVAQNFWLTPLPGAPVVTPVTRPPEVPATIVNSQLKRWYGGSWVTVTSVADVDRAKQTVVMTHGWNSNPDVWADDMAGNFFLSQANDTANILAWDWRDNAGTGPLLSLAYSRTPGQGRRLAQTLTNLLGTSYVQGIHFIGHSLGTLVNATAADYLHKKTSGAFDHHRTQMTLLDNAALANVEGRLIPVGYKIAGFESFLGLGDPPPLGWVSPLPEQRQWADNYMSFVGLYHNTVVNVWLPNGIFHDGQINPIYWHGYACGWYGDTAGNTSLSILGNRYSFERLGVNGQFPSPSPYPAGRLFEQYTENKYALRQVDDVVGFRTRTAAAFAQSKLLDGLNWLADTGEKIGDAVVDVVESGVAVAVDVAGDVQQGASWIVSQSIGSLRATLRSAASVLPLQQSGVPLARRAAGTLGSDDYTNSPSAVWLPVEIPTNAALFSFEFTFTGDGGQDVLSASIAGTNVFALEAQDMPEGQLLDSGPIAVSQWQGQTVELFFGLLGGTSTNTTISITGMRFYQFDPPFLSAHLAGANIVVSWPATVTGYSLESTAGIGSPSWSAITNVPTHSGMRQYVTNSVSGESRFYRLKKN